MYAAGHPRKLPATSEAGFSLLEVAFAVVVLGFALSTAITVMQRAFSSIDAARGLTYAAQIMQHEVERMRATPWGDGTAGAGSGTTGVSAYPAGPTPTTVPIDSSFSSIPSVGSRFIMGRTATTVRSGLIKVVLSVSWRGYDGRSLTRSFVAYYGKNGLYDFISA